jgi:radical SAM protein with 4Fe4S-binding SPASM domain
MMRKLPDDDYFKSYQKTEANVHRIRGFIDEALKLGTRRFQFTGNGEVFLYENSLELMERAKKAGSHCLAFTNGTLLFSDTIDELIKIGFDELRISILAGTKEMYLRTHPGIGENAFSKLENHLLNIAEKKAELKVKRPRVTLVYVVMKENYDGIFDFARFAASVNADQVIFNPIDEVGDEGLANLLLSEEQVDCVRKQFIKVKQYFEKRKIVNNINFFLRVFRGQLDTKSLYRIIPCYYGWLSTIVESDGNVYPCCRCYEPLGNIFEKSFREIWYGYNYEQFRKNALKINRTKDTLSGCDCNSCNHYNVNIRVYKLFHPVKGRVAQYKSEIQQVTGV